MRRVVLRAAAVVGALACAPAAGAWTWPAGGAVLQPFVFDPAHPYAGGEHRGIDVGGDAGSAVLAPAAGTVSFAGSVPTSGKSVTIQTPDGLSVTLTHLGSIGVIRNAVVAEGSSVGTIGPSGTPEAAEPYLHLGIRVTAQDQGYLDPLAFLPPRVGLPPPVPEAEASSAEPAAEADAGAVPPVAEPEPAPAEPLAATADEVADSTFLQPVTDSPPKPAPPDIVAEPGAAAESSVGPASPAEEPVDAATMPDPQPEPEAPPVEAASPDAAPVAVAEATEVASAPAESPPADAAPAPQEGSHSGPVAEPVAAPAVAAPAPAPVESADPAPVTETVPAAETAPASVQPAPHPTSEPVAPAPSPEDQPASVDRPQRPDVSNAVPQPVWNQAAPRLATDTAARPTRRQHLHTQVQLVRAATSTLHRPVRQHGTSTGTTIRTWPVLPAVAVVGLLVLLAVAGGGLVLARRRQGSAGGPTATRGGARRARRGARYRSGGRATKVDACPACPDRDGSESSWPSPGRMPPARGT